MREFNTSGPNIPKWHYTLQRENLIKKGIELVRKERYFTIWAPRQTGKSTYFRQLSKELEKIGYKPVYISVEGFNDFSAKDTFDTLCRGIKNQQQIEWDITSIKDFEKTVSNCTDKKIVIIIDEIEGLNPKIFGQFLHTIRNLYHSRHHHCLKSVILVGVTNIVGVISDNASPFNIADNLEVPYFTTEETFELLHQHETETGQLFEEKVKQKISEITANQPGLVNGFAKKLVEDNPDKPVINYNDYLEAEHWYLYITIDKNIANILNKAKQYKPFVEQLLFIEKKIPFDIDREPIKVLHTNGLIKEDKDRNVEFWVPLYRKRLYKVFYPYSNGEVERIAETMLASAFLTKEGKINFTLLVNKYKEHIKLRSFRPFREKDENGNYKSIKEAAMIYSFETFITIFLQEIDGKSYREAYASLGNTDLIINAKGYEYLIETKRFYSNTEFRKGKNQLAYYCNSLGLTEGVYLVFLKSGLHYSADIKEQSENINNIHIQTFLIPYDEEKDF